MTPVWHPPPAVLELLELVLTGGLPDLPETLALLGVEDLPTLAGESAGAWPAGEPVVIEDAEGTPVARWEPGNRLTAQRHFTAGPLRAHRRTPADLAGRSRPPLLTVLVDGLPAAAEVAGVRASLHDHQRLHDHRGERLRWLVAVGTGRGPLSAEASWRAVRELAAVSGASGSGAQVVPVVVPRLPGPGGDDVLLAEVARRWGYPGAPVRVLTTPPDGPFPEPFQRELRRAVPPPSRRGVTVFFTGLSGSGKSTLAKALAAGLREDGRREVTLLDGDEVRRLLSQGLGFSRQDRELNIRRIGFVATEVTRHGGVAICAPIAPFADVRAQVRTAVEAVGDLVLVHVATPLAECERRDRKGLYARARRGEVPEFTGISAPYEVPTDADVVIDTTGRSVPDCLAPLWELLVSRGYLGAG